MKLSTAHIINASILLIMGLWGAYYSYAIIGSPSFSPLIAPILGSLFLILTPLVIKNKKVITYAITGLSIIMGLLLFTMPFKQGLLADSNNITQLVRIFSMAIGCLFFGYIAIKNKFNENH